MASFSVLSVFVAAFLYGSASFSVIEPTVTNSSGEYYIISREETAGNQSITCSSTNCHVLCAESLSCMNLNISAYDAISLTVECPSSASCIESNIMCPKQNMSSIKDTFCDISCADALSCANTSIELHAVHSFNLLCNAKKACSYVEVWLASASIAPSVEMGDISVQCTEEASCEHMAWTRRYYHTVHSQLVLNSLDIQCTGTQSCQYMKWIKQLFLKNMTLQCTGYKSCQYMSTSFVWSESHYHIHCGATLACYRMRQSLCTVHAPQTSITCDNPATSSNATGSCYRSYFNFADYPSRHIAGNINISCNTFDCQNMKISSHSSGNREHNMSLYCNDHYSCHGASLDAYEMSSFDLYCKGTNACSNTNVSCPTGRRGAGVCNIYCADGGDVCASFGIKTAYRYIAGSVHVFCESMDSDPSCNDVYFECGRIQYAGEAPLRKKNTFLKYNDGGDHSQCVVNETVVYGGDYCCPLTNATGIIEPTVTNATGIIEPTVTNSTDIVESTVTNSKDKKENKSWFVAAAVCVGVVLLLVIVCAVAVFVVKKRSESKRSPALLDDNDTKQGTYEPPKEDTEMTKTAAM